MEMEEETDMPSQQEEMPPAVSAVLDSTTELIKVFFFSPQPFHSLLSFVKMIIRNTCQKSH